MDSNAYARQICNESDGYSVSMGSDTSVNPSKQTDNDRRRSDGRRLVPKGSLDEGELVKAKIAAKCTKSKERMTEEELQKERRAANRLSAFQSRLRRKVIIKDLQKTVAALTKDNADYKRQNMELKQDLEATRRENAALRMDNAKRSPQASSQSMQQVLSQPVAHQQTVQTPAVPQTGDVSDGLVQLLSNGQLSSESMTLIAELFAIKQQRDNVMKQMEDKQQVQSQFPLIQQQRSSVAQSQEGALQLVCKLLLHLQQQGNL